MNIFTSLSANKYRHYCTLVKCYRYYELNDLLFVFEMFSYFTCVDFFLNRYGLPKFTLVTIQKRFKKDDNLSTLFVPVPVKPNPDDINVGAELTGRLNKGDLLKVLNRFYQKPEIKQLALENGLDSKIIFQFKSNSIHTMVVMFQIICNIKRI